MKISAIIRNIQKSDFDKKSAITSVFDELRIMYPSTKAELLQAVEKTVCDNIDGPANLVPFHISSGSDPGLINKFLAELGLGLVQGDSGVFYISWCKQLTEENEDELEVILHDLHDAGQKGFLYEALSIIQKCYPEKEFQLLSGNQLRALKTALASSKNLYPIFDDALYLLAKD